MKFILAIALASLAVLYQSMLVDAACCSRKPNFGCCGNGGCKYVVCLSVKLDEILVKYALRIPELYR